MAVKNYYKVSGDNIERPQTILSTLWRRCFPCRSQRQAFLVGNAVTPSLKNNFPYFFIFHYCVCLSASSIVVRSSFSSNGFTMYP